MARGLDSTSTVTEREQLTRELINRLQSEDDPMAREELVEKLTRTNLPLCDSLANRYAGRGIEFDDLQQVARMGLLLAIERFRPGPDRTFAKFAVPTILGELKRYFRDHSWTVRPPRAIQELRPRVEATRTRLAQELRREPTQSELAELLEADPGDVSSCLESSTSYRSISLDAPLHPGTEVSLGNSLATAVGLHEELAARVDLQRALARLPRRDQQVVVWRFGDELTQAEIAERLGVSQMQISRVLRRVIERLRSDLSPALAGAA
ncbi:RNA polymerase sigma-B factor [Tessaracoccus bendigoensis DSM 12906]|uniref:RNA polymerase sigma-B factor n=1 Tax=Tessaracoccus bendigoensis DSM 12906 TaxID=1123357 RepID=A0A1M6ESQ1_9ACTN|nr:sigma-70 family RNA polymerase sigma factor [Tessaracoccus bendigoensis]SHI88423.1 RNA polymerase sigma-B factor [Tessaracoccus bendigoensis DSM 12906]